MACRYSHLKLVFIAFNVLLALIGIGYIAFSVYEWLGHPVVIDTATLIVQFILGLLLVFNSVLGWFVADRVSLRLIGSYVICLLILLGLQIYLIDRDSFKSVWLDLEQNADVIDKIQQKYKCCGEYSSRYYEYMNVEKPLSCYEDLNNGYYKPYTSSCMRAIEVNRSTILYAKWTALIIELLPLCLGLYLWESMNSQVRRQF